MAIDMRKVDRIAGQIAGLITSITDMISSEPDLTPYDILGVKPSDSDKIIDVIYKARVSLAHPDKGGDETECKRLNEAYEQIKAERKGDHDKATI